MIVKWFVFPLLWIAVIWLSAAWLDLPRDFRIVWICWLAHTTANWMTTANDIADDIRGKKL